MGIETTIIVRFKGVVEGRVGDCSRVNAKDCASVNVSDDGDCEKSTSNLTTCVSMLVCASSALTTLLSSTVPPFLLLSFPPSLVFPFLPYLPPPFKPLCFIFAVDFRFSEHSWLDFLVFEGMQKSLQKRQRVKIKSKRREVNQ